MSSATVLRWETAAALLAVVAGLIIVRRQSRRWERETAEHRMTGIPPRWHPDSEAWLSEDDWDELDGIAAATEGRADTGLRILGSEGEAL